MKEERKEAVSPGPCSKTNHMHHVKVTRIAIGCSDVLAFNIPQGFL
jgi:hypothetical protein